MGLIMSYGATWYLGQPRVILLLFAYYHFDKASVCGWLLLDQRLLWFVVWKKHIEIKVTIAA